MTKVKTAEKMSIRKGGKNGSLQNSKTINGNHREEGKIVGSTLSKLNKNYLAASTKKEKDDARKALTLATFSATYENHQKRRS